ncbi:N-6 DNA methylase [Fulvivirgaceae bacterium BMA12]|uniref:N-6 DNA methylase n=1 Tax=Agaribacillus aureus TaxID=3051825 RepID=A0ABT8LAE0_9BACT|nr:N-6 DNA methylase [Fulvivirgaceae bacterium BMA12]
MEVIAADISNKKHLGQYFSGNAIASLLAHLADYQKARSVIDPMSGTGDMIAACEPSTNPDKHYYGVEIDHDVIEQSIQRFQSNPNVKLLDGNVFKPNIIRQLASNSYDLVITNPPYVRYQTINDNKVNQPESLGTPEIKENLIASLPLFKHLDAKDRELFSVLISNYSGLADLAVPSWFLCALITKVGGKIAMVVPQTWLNRNYAGVIHYLLLKWFQIEYIVEDANSAWFQSAQVKTTLIVAKRIERKELISTWKKECLTYCSVFSAARNENSLIGKIFPSQPQPEKRFVKTINNGKHQNGLFATSKIRLADFANDLKKNTANQRWFRLVEPEQVETTLGTNSLKVPSKLRSWLENRTDQFQSLYDIGVNVSQGLRTGANIFFYMDIVESVGEGIIARPGKPFEPKSILIPSEFYREVIRKQSELDESFDTSAFVPKGIVLSLQSGICQEDLKALKGINIVVEHSYQVLPEELSKHICRATKLNIGTKDNPKFIPVLSAVAPNVKAWNPNRPKELPRYWYMLPPFTKRHCPDLFIPRVNGLHPFTRLNNGCKYLIDANFSTLWISDDSHKFNHYAILALLNSSWCIVAMEEYGTVMGGGALKLEATQIKKLPVPVLSAGSVEKLSTLGKRLAHTPNDTNKTLAQIDRIVIAALGFETELENKIANLISLKDQLLNQRNSK